MQPTSHSFPANARAGLADPILQQALGLARTGFPQRRLEAIARLPDPYRKVVEFRYRDKKTFPEIGRILEKSADAVRELVDKLKL